MPKILILITLMVMATGCNDSAAVTHDIDGIIINVDTTYYDISPDTVADIGPELNRRSPIGGLRKYHGYLKWYVTWDYDRLQLSDGCEITDVTVTVDIDYTLPRLRNEHALPYEVSSAFNQYYDALKAHEDGHADHGVDAGVEVKSALTGLSGNDCDGLSSKASSRGRSIVSKYANKDRRYDARTGHGRTEGVVLP